MNKDLEEKAKRLQWDRRLLDDRSPNVQAIPIADINNDPNYQRDISEPQLASMLDQYNPAELTIAVVSKRADGSLWMIDGRHRTELLRRMGKSLVWADVMEGLTFEQEAWLFYRLNVNHRSMSPWFKFNARLQAHDVGATRIVAIVGKHGYRVTKHREDRGIQAVSALQVVFDMGKLDKTLSIIAAAWPHDRNAIDASMITGLGVFLASYDKDPAYDDGQLLLSIEKLGPSGITRRAKEIQLETGRTAQGGATIAIAFRDAYNGRLVRGSRPKKQLIGMPLVSWKRMTGVRG